jgi:hypothetical protein
MCDSRPCVPVLVQQTPPVLQHLVVIVGSMRAVRARAVRAYYWCSRHRQYCNTHEHKARGDVRCRVVGQRGQHRVIPHEVAAPLRRVPRSHLPLPPGRGRPRHRSLRLMLRQRPARSCRNVFYNVRVRYPSSLIQTPRSPLSVELCEAPRRHEHPCRRRRVAEDALGVSFGGSRLLHHIPGGRAPPDWSRRADFNEDNNWDHGVDKDLTKTTKRPPQRQNYAQTIACQPSKKMPRCVIPIHIIEGEAPELRFCCNYI